MIEFRLFGKLEVIDGDARRSLDSAKLVGMLAVLVIAGQRPVSRERMADLLWGSRFDEQARQNLRQALSRLRRLLGAEVLRADEQAIRIDPNRAVSDYARFEKHLDGEVVEELREAVELAREGFLAGLAVREPAFQEWLLEQRRSIDRRLRKVHQLLAAAALKSGDGTAALFHAEDILRADPLDEEGHRLRLQALSALGRKREALEHHQAFVRELKTELDAAPEEATLIIVNSLKSRELVGRAVQQVIRPSIAVMPFANLSGDVEQSYFADGIVDELITGLSRLPWLTVISRSCSFAYKDRSADSRIIARELGVRYVLEGSIRRAEATVRITGQLIDAENGLSIWAAHFNGSLNSIFELQDQVTSKVIGAIQPRLEHAELERSRRKPTSSLGAYDYYLRGIAEVHRWSREANREALANFYKAIELDRRFAAAYGMAARCLSQRKTGGWVEDEDRERAEAAGLASLAVELGPDDPVALAAAGIALAFVVGRVREGGELIERSLEINPGHAVTWMFSCWVKAWSGEWEEAIARANRAVQLSPSDPYVAGMRRANAFAQFIGGRYQDAIDTAEAVATSPQNAAIGAAVVAASAALLGRADQARAAMGQLLAAEPRLRMTNLRTRFPIVKDGDFQRFAQGLHLAGLPD